MNEGIKKLALDLARADTETEVINILKRVGLWDDSSVWREYGDDSMNYSTIGNQQSSADNALVEKLINSVDAVLMRECLKRRINPAGSDAPKSIADAQKQFFGVYNGKLSGIDSKERTKLAENIWLVATGGGKMPSLSIVDKGEGQSPERMPKTLLSLTKSNKISIPFVQGKYGMGGSGVLRFCSSKNRILLVISKRNYEIDAQTDDKLYGKDDSRDSWGVTVVRRENPKGGEKNSHYTYLVAPDGKILPFGADELPLLPGSEPMSEPLKSGTFIKLYEYDIGSGLRSNVLFNLNYRLALLMPDVALPVRVAERRSNFSGHSLETTIAGLSVRLDDDRRDNLEPEFSRPSTGSITVDNQELDYSIYVFKKDKKKNYAGAGEGVVFSINGQAHGFISNSFFRRKTVRMDYIADSILVVVDCSKMDRGMQEDLFMPSRDRLARGTFRTAIEENLMGIIRKHPGLKDLQTRRRTEAIENKLKGAKVFIEIIQDMIQKEPGILGFLNPDRRGRLNHPSKTEKVTGEIKEYVGKEFPTYFNPVKSYPIHNPKQCPRNQKFRIDYETDVDNDYFRRDKDPGTNILTLNGKPVQASSLNLWNGLAHLNVNLPLDVNIGETLCFELKISEAGRIESFSNRFWVRVESDNIRNSTGGGGERKVPPGDEPGKDRQIPLSYNIPNVVEVDREEWGIEKYKEFKFDENSALKVRSVGDEKGYDFFVNMGNRHLLDEERRKSNTAPKVLKEKYKYGMVLLGMSVIRRMEREEKKDDNEFYDGEIPIDEQVALFTEAASQVLLPMISYLGDLDES